MKQVYVTAISLQGVGGLEKLVYEPHGFEYEKKPLTSFPIIPVIANTVESNANTVVIALRSKGTEDNYEAFVDELEAMGIGRNQVVTVEVGEYSSQKAMLKLLLDIMNAIPDNSLVYADITFQTKPVSVMLVTAMGLVDKIKNDMAEVRGIYYGEAHRDNVTHKVCGAYLHDITAMKNIADMTNQLSMIGVKDISKFIEKMLGE